MSKRRRATQLACRNPSIRLSPLPAGSGSTVEPFPQICGGHRINVDADILGEETCEGLQTSAFQTAVNVFKRSNHQGKTCDEAHRRLRVSVYGRARVDEKAARRRQRRGAHRCDEASREFPGWSGLNGATVRQKKPAGADFAPELPKLVS